MFCIWAQNRFTNWETGADKSSTREKEVGGFKENGAVEVKSLILISLYNVYQFGTRFAWGWEAAGVLSCAWLVSGDRGGGSMRRRRVSQRVLEASGLRDAVVVSGHMLLRQRLHPSYWLRNLLLLGKLPSLRCDFTFFSLGQIGAS